MDIPRELIYEDRSSLNRFGINDMGSLNELIYDNYLIETTDLCQRDDNSVNRILKAFNDAYYICTIVLMQPSPIFGLSYYIKRVNIPQVVFPMVFLYLSKVNTNSLIITRIQKIIASEAQRKNDWNKNFAYVQHISGLYDGSVDSSTFTQRKITSELLSKIKWCDATDCFNKDSINRIVINVCRSREDWRMMVEAIKSAAQKYDYEFGFEDYFEEGFDENGLPYSQTIKVPKDPYDYEGNEILEPLKRAGVYQYCDYIKEKYDELSIEATKANEIRSENNLQTTITMQPNNGNDEEEDELGEILFHDNLNTKKIKETVRTLPKSNLSNRQFCKVLYDAFCTISWLSDTTKAKFIRWFNNKVGIKFETKNFKGMKDNEEMIKKKGIFISHFSDKSQNGGYKDKDDFYKKDILGNSLSKINNSE